MKIIELGKIVYIHISTINNLFIWAIYEQKLRRATRTGNANGSWLAAGGSSCAGLNSHRIFSCRLSWDMGTWRAPKRERRCGGAEERESRLHPRLRGCWEGHSAVLLPWPWDNFLIKNTKNTKNTALIKNDINEEMCQWKKKKIAQNPRDGNQKWYFWSLERTIASASCNIWRHNEDKLSVN